MAKQTVIVSVLADTKKFSSAMRNLSRETGLSKLTSGFKNLGSKVADTFKTGIKLAGGMAAAIGGMALAGGLKRALAVEDATFLMEQLGMSTKEISTALEAVDRTFDGTPFANPDGFNFSAQLRASGKGLDQIERDLRTTSNLTAMTLDKDFGRISELFLKMAANGRVTATDLNSIGLAGYPIRQVLAEALDTSVDGLNKMVSSGELTYDAMMELLDGVEDLDGAAKNLGDNTKVSFSNMLTAFSMVGEKFVTQVLPTFKDVFQDIRGYVRDLRGPAEAAGKAFKTFLEETAIPAVKRLASWISEKLWPVLKRVGEIVGGAFSEAWTKVRAALDAAGFAAGDTASSLGDTLLSALEITANVIAFLVDKVSSLVSWFIRHRKAIGFVATAVLGAVAAFQTFSKIMAIARAAMIVFNIAMNANPIGLIITAIGALVAALVWFFTQTEIGQKIVTVAWEAIKTAVSAVVEWFQTYVQPVLSAVWDAISEAASAAADWWNTHVSPLFEAGGEYISAVFDLLQAAATALWENGLQPVFSFIAEGWTLLWNDIQTIWDTIGPPIMAVISLGFQNLQTVISTIWNAIKIVIETVLGVIKGIINTVTAVIRGDWRGAWEGIKSIGSTIWNGIKSLISNQINAIKTTISNVVESIRSTWSNKWNAVKTTALNTWESIKTGATTKFNAMLTFIREIPTKIKNVFSNAGSWLLDAGRRIISGLVDGIKGAFGRVRETLSGLTDLLPSWKGPRERDRRLLVKPGQWIISGLVRGLESEYDSVRRSLGGLTNTIAGTSFTAPSAVLAGGGAGRGRSPVTVNVYALQDGPEVGRRVHDALESFYAINGRRY